MEPQLCSVLFVTLCASFVVQESLHRETQLCAAVSVTVAVNCFTDMALHICKFWYQWTWPTLYMASVSNEQQHMDCTITGFVALHVCNAHSLTHCQAMPVICLVPSRQGGLFLCMQP